MGIIGSSWKDETSNEEEYNYITGSQYNGRDAKELKKDIERSINDGYCSKSEREKLRDLLRKIEDKNE
jgi:hypothetical protein